MAIGLGSILGGGLQIGGAVVNGILGARSAAKQRKMLAQQKQDNENWYNRRYNEVGTERADAKAALTAMREAQAQRMANNAGMSAVMGTSSAQRAQEKQAANNAIGNTIQAINNASEARKASIENQYMTTKSTLSNKEMQMEQQRADNIANAVTNASKAASDMFGAIPSLNKKG